MLNSLQAQKDLKDLEIIGRIFLQVTGHRSPLWKLNWRTEWSSNCKQSLRSYLSHQFKNSLIIHKGKKKDNKKLMFLYLIKTAKLYIYFLDQNSTKFKC